MKKFNYLNEHLKASPLGYDPSQNIGGAVKETPMPAAPPMRPPPAPPAQAHLNSIAPPPQLNLNAVPNVGAVPQNLSRITKFQKLDKFPHIYKLLKS